MLQNMNKEDASVSTLTLTQSLRSLQISVPEILARTLQRGLKIRKDKLIIIKKRKEKKQTGQVINKNMIVILICLGYNIFKEAVHIYTIFKLAPFYLFIYFFYLVNWICQHLQLSPEDHSEELQSKTNSKSYVQPQEYSCQTGPHPNNLEENDREGHYTVYRNQ